LALCPPVIPDRDIVPEIIHPDSGIPIPAHFRKARHHFNNSPANASSCASLMRNKTENIRGNERQRQSH